jgi:hypothetical protein
MQPRGDLEHAWIMSDHIKCVAKWTTMACHVYYGTYQCVMTIACCNFQSEDKDAEVLFWHNLNYVMARHGIPKPHFKGFMADSAQANWNAVRIVYGSGDPKVPIDGRERIYSIRPSFWINTPNSISSMTCKTNISVSTSSIATHPLYSRRRRNTSLSRPGGLLLIAPPMRG